MDDEVIENMEVDLEIADIGELLTAHGVTPTAELVVALWEWKEARLRNAGDE